MSNATPEQDGVFSPGLRPETDNNEYNALTFMIRNLISGVNVAMPVQVVSANITGGITVPFNTVSVKPLVNMIDGSGRSISHTTIFNIPVLRFGGAQGAFVYYPTAGDIGLAVFCDRDISSVKASRKQAQPGSLRRFSFSDGVYIGSLFSNAPSSWSVMDEFGLLVSPKVSVQGDTDVTGVYTVNGTQVVGPRGATVTPPTGGGTIDAQARQAINDLINRLQTHGLIS